ncbi:MAG: hypothetical protein M1812_000964 [Candelaria pacifica]|nr:MAG: hypothetical protein M1812_000964 [Candelaria pacifica]
MCYPETLAPSQIAGHQLEVAYHRFETHRYSEDVAEQETTSTQLQHFVNSNRAFDWTGPDARALAYQNVLDDIHGRLYPQREEDPEEPLLIMVEEDPEEPLPIMATFHNSITTHLMHCHQCVVDGKREPPNPGLLLLKHFVKETLPIKLDYNSWVGQLLITEIARRYNINKELIVHDPRASTASERRELKYVGHHLSPFDLSPYDSKRIRQDLRAIRVVLGIFAVRVFRWVAIEAKVTGEPGFRENLSRSIPWNWDPASPHYTQYASQVLGWRWFDLPWFSTF